MLPTKTFEGLTADKQRKIYHSAIKEFAEKGYTQASTANICKEANISKGSIFQYFQTKTSLFFCVVQQALREVIDDYKFNNEINDENVSFKEIFVKSCKQLFEIYENYPYHYKLYQRINNEDDIPNYQEIRRYLSRFVSKMANRLIIVGKKRKLIRADLSKEMIKFIVENFLVKFIEVYSRKNGTQFQTSEQTQNFLTKRNLLIDEVYSVLTEGITAKDYQIK